MIRCTNAHNKQKLWLDNDVIATFPPIFGGGESGPPTPVVDACDSLAEPLELYSTRQMETCWQ